MNLVFQNLGTEAWTAGSTFLEGTLQALRFLNESSLSLTVVVDGRFPESQYASVRQLADHIVTAPLPPLASGSVIRLSFRGQVVNWIRRRILRQTASVSLHPLDGLLKSLNADCYISIAWGPATKISLPNITWIVDFQHRRMPELFTRKERERRDGYFSEHARLAALIWTKSDTVHKDCQVFLPDHSHKARTVRYVAPVPQDIYAVDPTTVLSNYHLPDKFFYLPNQFWKHKNHGVVFDALNLLRSRGVTPNVVCTGVIVDDRYPVYFSDILQMLARHDLHSQVYLLGVVPRRDVFLLMRQSVCVLSSTLFEGFGMSVAEANSLGKRLLVSNLPVLQEHGAPATIYFDPNNVHELADIMEMIWKTTLPGPDCELEAAARDELPIRQRRYGRELLTLAADAARLFQLQGIT